MITNMTQKRQVTVPKAICDEEGFQPGKPVRVERLAGGGVGLYPAAQDAAQQRADIEARLDALLGSIKSSETTDELMRRIRDPLP
jgi:bifunctional DNA-binding transcriptional regulator/antitoxin component of YhaV-PrlF toxin-antitoxin module